MFKFKIYKVSNPEEIARYGRQQWRGDLPLFPGDKSEPVIKKGWYFRIGSYCIGWLS